MTSKHEDHIIIGIEPRGYIHFVCAKQPKMELRSYEAPRICPICRTISPIKMGVLETTEIQESAFKSDEIDDKKWVTR